MTTVKLTDKQAAYLMDLLEEADEPSLSGEWVLRAGIEFDGAAQPGEKMIARNLYKKGILREPFCHSHGNMAVELAMDVSEGEIVSREVEV